MVTDYGGGSGAGWCAAATGKAFGGGFALMELRYERENACRAENCFSMVS